MCHTSVLAFGARVLTTEAVAGKTVLEVGAYNVNGSLRGAVERLEPALYRGIDIRPGPGVDRLYDASEPGLCGNGVGPFDLVICTEMLEHVRDWRAVVTNLKASVAPGGHLLVTTRSLGFPRHDFPEDHWRFSLLDFQEIFADFEILALESDGEAPGVLLYARQTGRAPVNLSAIEPFSMAGRLITAVVPSRTDAYLNRLLQSLNTSEPGSAVHVVVADNGLSTACRAAWRFRFVTEPMPFCFSHAINQAVALTPPDSDLLILNDDVVMVTPQWRTKAMALLASPALAHYGLLSFAFPPPGGHPAQHYVPALADAPPVPSAQTLAFTACLVRRACWTAVGPMDERFVGYGRDDDDYCVRARLLGWATGVSHALVVQSGIDGYPHSARCSRTTCAGIPRSTRPSHDLDCRPHPDARIAGADDGEPDGPDAAGLRDPRRRGL
jgi:SAM-dependent methyltransferase